MSVKIKWSFEDDYTVAAEYIRFIFDEGADVARDVSELVEKLSLALPHISRGSIRMKLQNLKAISDERMFEDGVDLSPLYQYSAQSEMAFDKACSDRYDRIQRERDEALLAELRERGEEELDDGGFMLISQDPDEDELLVNYSPLEGAAVLHKHYGEGVVESLINGNRMVVKFEKNTAEFLYPTAFSRYLEFKDPDKQRRIMELLTIYEKGMERLKRIKTKALRRGMMMYD